MLSRLFLVFKEFAGARFVTLIVFTVIALSTSAVMTFIVISENFNRHIDERFASHIPADEIIVRHGRSSGFFIFSSGTGKKLDQRGLQRIASLDGVRSAEPVVSLAVPSSASISFFTFRFATDLVIAGAPASLVGDALTDPAMRRAWERGSHARGVPLIIPGTLIDSYNSGLAGANRMPEIIPEKLSGISIGLRIGESSMHSIEGAHRINAVIAGVSRRINVAGVILPAAAVNELNRSFGRSGEYIFAVVKTSDHSRADEVKKRIESMGYRIDSGPGISSEIVKIQRAVNYFITSVIMLIIILAAAASGLCTMAAIWGRMEYYRLLRILGASKIFIAFMVIFKFSAAGAAAGLFGMAPLYFFADQIAAYSALQGIDIVVPLLSGGRFMQVLLACTLIPGGSALPAVMRFFTLKLNIN